MLMRIIMTMNIYITKDNEKYLRNMKNENNFSMSGLINDLIFHAREVRGDIAAAPTQEEFETKLVEPKKIAEKPTTVIKTPEQAAKIVQTVSGGMGGAKGMSFCKEGHPIPEGRTKCLGKGCKYS